MKIILDEDRFDLAKLFKGTGVEIGVADGTYSNCVMSLGEVTKMYGVDPYERHRGYMDYTHTGTFNRLEAKAHQQLDRYDGYQFKRMYSLEAVKEFTDESLDFVYIDGDHSYEAVKADIQAWLPKVKPGGIIAGDDYILSVRDKRFYDVIRAVDEFVEENNIKTLYIYGKGRTPSNWMWYKT